MCVWGGGGGGGGGVRTSTEGDQIINVGMIRYASSKDNLLAK